MFAHDLVGHIRQVAVRIEVFQAGTHETEWFVFWPFFYLKDPVDRLRVKDVTADAVHGVGGIADNPTLPEKRRHLVKQTLLGVIGVDG